MATGYLVAAVGTSLQYLSDQGIVLSGGTVSTFVAGTTTPVQTYTDSTLGVSNGTVITLTSTGRLPASCWVGTGVSIKMVLKDSLNNTIANGTIDNLQGINDPAYLTGASIGAALFPRTSAEIAAGITPSNYVYQGLEVIDVLRYGIIPNSSGAAANNSTQLIALGNATVTGPQGIIEFPNTTGADIYYFSGIAHQFRSGIVLELNGCTLNFSKTYAGSDDTHGFIEAIKNFTIQNGAINVNYTGVGGNNPGPALRLGSRSGYAFGNYPAGVFDQDDNVFQGNITVRNMKITSNNPVSAGIVLLFGGLVNVVFDNVDLDSASGVGPDTGIYYEFGFASKNSFPGDSTKWSSSHAHSMFFRNVRCSNLNTSHSDGAAIAIVGGYSSIVDGLFVNGSFGGFEYRVGEAMNYRPWVGVDTVGVKRGIVLRNINCQSVTTYGLSLGGAQSAAGGYLAGTISALGHPADYVAETDLMTFSVDGFAVSGATEGVVMGGGDTILRNGLMNACTNGIIIQDECVQFDIDNVEVLNSTSIGIRCQSGTAIWAPPRLKRGQIRNSKICGSTGPGISVLNSHYVEIVNCQIGFNVLYDAVNESTQTVGVSVDATTAGGGVYCRGCYVTTSGGANAYSITGTLCNPCGIFDPKGLMTTSGSWDIEGMAYYSSTVIADKTAFINNNNTALTAITFTGAPSGTSATLNANWTSPSGTYPLLFQDAEFRYAVFTNASATVTWTGALTGAPTAAGNLVGIIGTNKYIGRRCYDTSNTRVMIAQGSTNTSTWIRADGGVTVTPS